MLAKLHSAATAAGLTRLWVASREAVDAAFAAHPAHLATPARLHPHYRRALVLGSAGPDFWRGFRAARGAQAAPAPLDPAGDPLDRYTEQVLESLAATLRATDPTVCTVYPFRHARQLLGFRKLLAAAPWLDASGGAGAPFGVAVEPRAGPWWALRGALLTTLELPAQPPADPLAGASPCAPCPAPCVTACPAGAVRRTGLDWQACGDYRLSGPTCRGTCPARLACPVGADQRYDADAMAHHYTASLRELAALRGQAGNGRAER